jgi:hypothetical protein
MYENVGLAVGSGGTISCDSGVALLWQMTVPVVCVALTACATVAVTQS